jgi:hypothetical protein
MVVDTGASRLSWFVIPLLEPLNWMLIKDSSSRAHDTQDRSQQHHFTQIILLTRSAALAAREVLLACRGQRPNTIQAGLRLTLHSHGYRPIFMTWTKSAEC